VSERMRRMKAAENVRCPDVTMNPIAQQVKQTSETLKDTTISPSFVMPLDQVTSHLSFSIVYLNSNRCV